MRAELVRAAVVVFIASFCTLVVELVAGRILAPHVGVSLYTWTSIIGIVLAGISGGAYAGGWIADRRPLPSTLGWSLLVAGLLVLFIAPATTLLATDDGLLTRLGIAETLVARVVVLSILLFFLPSFFLGMISPVAVKLAVRDLDTTGRVVGKIYAFSTLGSILGTFVTGFFLIARFGTRATLVGVAVLLVMTAFLAGDLAGRRGRVLPLVAVPILLAAYASVPSSPPSAAVVREPGEYHFEESAYYTIRLERTVREDTGAPLEVLYLDHLAHSYTDLADPKYLEYGYLQIFNEMIRWTSAEDRSPRLLFIGGGGYTLPRLAETSAPRPAIEVVEIDPAVTRVAQRYLALPSQTTIRTHSDDARWFAIRSRSKHDAIFVDAFNDLSVPAHLTTLEATEGFRRLLDDGGVFAANLVDDYSKGRFLVSYIRTVQQVFGRENVALLMDSEDDISEGRSTFVVVASGRLDDLLHFMYGPRSFGESPFAVGYRLPHDDLQQHLARRNAIVLTDDYAPVDAMLAPIFRDRFAEE